MRMVTSLEAAPNRIDLAADDDSERHLLARSEKEDVMAGHFEIEARPDGQFMFSLKVGNEAILRSEAYTTKAACLKGIESVKKKAPDEGRYSQTTTPDGGFRFALDAPNGQTIGASAYYETTSARDDAFEFVMKNAPDAEVKDLA